MTNFKILSSYSAEENSKFFTTWEVKFKIFFNHGNKQSKEHNKFVSEGKIKKKLKARKSRANFCKCIVHQDAKFQNLLKLEWSKKEYITVNMESFKLIIFS